MQHCDPGVLGLVALGEQPSPQDAAHLDVCGECRADVEELSGVVAKVKVDVPNGPAVAPPPRVWDAIARGTGVTAAPRPDHVRGQGPVPVVGAGAPRPRSRREHRQGPHASGRPARPGRSARSWTLAAVAASALLVGAVGGGLAVSALGSGTDGDRLADPGKGAASGTVVARAPLAVVPGATGVAGASGTARVVQTADGRRLDVDVARLSPHRTGYYEVWLIDRGIDQMVSVGVLRGDGGAFVLPDGLDVGAYPVVDVSVETPGNPRHSGTSVLRGTIQG